MEDDVGTETVLLALFDGVSVDTVALPDVGLLGTVCLGDDLDVVGHHEGAVESDTELSDGFVLLVVDLLLELEGPGVGDVSEVLLHLVGGHPDTVVGYGDRLGIPVDLDIDAEVVLSDLAVGFRQNLVVELVYGIGCVGDELPEEDLLVGVDGVDHHVQNALRFRFELSFCHLSVIPRIVDARIVIALL